MKRLVLFSFVLLVCFGFVYEKEKIQDNCCEYRPFPCVGLKLLPPAHYLYKYDKFRLTENETFLLTKIEAKKDSAYTFSHRILNAYGYMETSVSVFILDEQNDTLVNSLLKGKKYAGLSYTSRKNETLRLYLNPHENPLLLQKHKKRDKCAKVRCVEYTIGIRTTLND